MPLARSMTDTWILSIRYIYFRVGSHPLAEDLTSETFLRALRRITDFTWQGRDFGAWLVTIARNLVADHFKSGRYRLEITTGEVIDARSTARTSRRTPSSRPSSTTGCSAPSKISTPSSRNAWSCGSCTACRSPRPR